MTNQTLPSTDTLPTTQRAERNELTNDLLRRADGASEPERRRLIDEAVLLNLEVARSIGRRYSRRGIEYDDLVQVAYLGLVNAAHRFDPDMGKDFASFAVPTMTGEVKRHFRDYGWTVRPPRRVQETHATLAAASAELAQVRGSEPSIADVAEHVGMDDEAVAQASASHECFAVASIDYRSTDSEDTPLHETLGDEDRQFDRAEAVVTLAPACRCLHPRDRRVIYLRFFRGWTQQEVATELGVTQMQISRLLTRILSQLRQDIGETP